MSFDLGHRINVCGTSGSGKSTLAREIARRTGVTYVELDAIHHGPNWTTVPTEEFRSKVADAIRGDGWVVDGNYAKARDIVWERVETILWLDYPLPLILWRQARRLVVRTVRREELWHGNREILWRHLLTRESLFWWVLTTYRQRRTECDRLFADRAHRHLRLLRFRTPRQTQAMLDSLSSS